MFVVNSPSHILKEYIMSRVVPKEPEKTILRYIAQDLEHAFEAKPGVVAPAIGEDRGYATPSSLKALVVLDKFYLEAGLPQLDAEERSLIIDVAQTAAANVVNRLAVYVGPEADLRLA